jgi:hypothetical protein
MERNIMDIMDNVLLVTAEMWPFKYFNGEQTPESLILETDKCQHETTPIDFNNFEDALL